MTVARKSRADSERKTFTYTKEMNELGVIDFAATLRNLQEERDQPDWDISKNRNADAENSELAMNYRKAWDAKW